MAGHYLYRLLKLDDTKGLKVAKRLQNLSRLARNFSQCAISIDNVILRQVLTVSSSHGYDEPIPMLGIWVPALPDETIVIIFN
jgi:hypothetical protein